VSPSELLASPSERALSLKRAVGWVCEQRFGFVDDVEFLFGAYTLPLGIGDPFCTRLQVKGSGTG
jgi:hypothetical protein